MHAACGHAVIWHRCQILVFAPSLPSTKNMIQLISTHAGTDDYLGLRLPWLRGRSWTRKVCLFLLYLVLYPPLACEAT